MSTPSPPAAAAGPGGLGPRHAPGNNSASSITTGGSWRLPAIKTTMVPEHNAPALPDAESAADAAPAGSELCSWKPASSAAQVRNRHDVKASYRLQQGGSAGQTGMGIHGSAAAAAGLLGPLQASDVVLNLQQLTAAAAVPTVSAVTAARMVGAGDQQVLQVFYTGAAAPAVAATAAGGGAGGPNHPSPSPRHVRELAQLLPPAPNSTSAAIAANGHAAAAIAAASAAEAGQAGLDGVACNGSSGAHNSGNGGSNGKGRAGSRVRRKLQQWRAAVGGRLGLGRGKARGGGDPDIRNGSGSMNEHTLGFKGEWLAEWQRGSEPLYSIYQYGTERRVLARQLSRDSKL